MFGNMSSGVTTTVLVLCIVAVSASNTWTPYQNTAVPAKQEATKTDEAVVESARSAEDNRWWLPVATLRGLRSLYDECTSRGEDSGMVCLKSKALVMLDRAMGKGNIALGEGVTLVRSAASSEKLITSEDQLDANLPRDLTQKESRLDDMLMNHFVEFVQTHTVKMDLGGRDFQNSVNEARKKGKKTMPYVLFAMITAGKLILAYSLKAIALIAGKALIIAKIALVLASIIGLKKLLHHEPEHSSHEVYAGGHHSGYGRSFGAQEQRIAEAQKLAYSMQIPKSV